MVVSGWKRRRTSALGALAAGGLSLCAVAQDPPLRPLLLDRAEAVVGSRVLLRSELDRAVYRFLRATGDPQTQDRVVELSSIALRQQINELSLTEGARTLGAFDAARVNEIAESEIQRIEDQQVQRLGSKSAFYDELRRSNQTYEQFRANERDRVMREFAQAQVSFGALSARQSLLFTPAEMRTFYDENIQLFVSGSRTELDIVIFTDRAKAEAAAKAWKATPAPSAKQILEAHGGALIEQYRGPDAFLGPAPGQDEPPARPDIAEFVTEFARSSTENEVKIHSLGEENHWVMRVHDRVEAQSRPFLDRQVQRQIRNGLLQRITQTRQLRATRRARSRIRVWAPGFRR